MVSSNPVKWLRPTTNWKLKGSIWIACALILVFSGGSAAVQGLHSATPNPTDYGVVNQLLEAAAKRYGIPPVVLKAIAFQESGWDHHWQPGDAARGAFSEQHHWRYWEGPADPTGYVKMRLEPSTPSFPQGAVGIGLMQITIPLDSHGRPRDVDYFRRLANDIAFNIDQAARHLLRFYSSVEEAPQLIENWWYPTYRYNGFGEQARAYSERVRNLVQRPPTKIVPFMQPMNWTLPWEVYPAFRAGSLRTGPADRFAAYPDGSFVFHVSGGPVWRTGAVHAWSSPDPADLRFVLIRGQQGQGTVAIQDRDNLSDFGWGESVTVTAHPEYGWEFSHWLDGAENAPLVGSSSPWGWPELTFEMTGHRYVEAVFVPLEDQRSVPVSIMGVLRREREPWPDESEAVLLVQRPGIRYGTASTSVDATGAFHFDQVNLDPRYRYVVAVRPTPSSARLTGHTPMIYVDGREPQYLELPLWTVPLH